MSLNTTPLERFIDSSAYYAPGQRVLFQDFFEAFEKTLDGMAFLDTPKFPTFAKLLTELRMHPDQRNERELEELQKKKRGLEQPIGVIKALPASEFKK